MQEIDVPSGFTLFAADPEANRNHYDNAQQIISQSLTTRAAPLEPLHLPREPLEARPPGSPDPLTHEALPPPRDLNGAATDA